MAAKVRTRQVAADLLLQAFPEAGKGAIRAAADSIALLTSTRAISEAEVGALASSLANHPGLPNFLTPAEVSSIMDVSKMTVYRLVHSGELPAIRVGRTFRIPEQAVTNYLARRHKAIS
jgi:excisionase family DNA binding protein